MALFKEELEIFSKLPNSTWENSEFSASNSALDWS